MKLKLHLLTIGTFFSIALAALPTQVTDTISVSYATNRTVAPDIEIHIKGLPGHEVDKELEALLNNEPEIPQPAPTSQQTTDLQDPNGRRWATTLMFFGYWDCREMARMIDAAHTTAQSLITDMLKAFEEAVGTRTLSPEERAELFSNIATEALGCSSLEELRGSLQKSQEQEAEESSSATPIQNPITNAMATPSGRALIGLVDLYHIILHRLANLAAEGDITPAIAFQLLEAQLFVVGLAKMQPIADKEDAHIADIKNTAMATLEAIHDFLQTKRRELYTPVINAALTVANHTGRPVHDLTYLDFEQWLEDHVE